MQNLPVMQNEIDAEEYRDHIATIDEKGKRVWIFPKRPKGKYTRYRTRLSWVLLAVLFALPWIKIGGVPLFMLNVPERKFVLFTVFFGPQDFFIFALLMITFIVFIALFTVAFGRLFCGWVCPQTVFMEMVFRKIEYWIEGDYTRQRALAKSAWTTEKIWKRTAKHSLFLLISFLIANTFLAYIFGSDALLQFVKDGPGPHFGLFVGLLLFTLVFYFVFSWMREQVCIIVCPYGRLQGVLLDQKSMVVAYDHVRGEPRGNPKKNKDKKLGDCIDCGQCVNVCPTGIDIRNGTQLECVGCTACIDACDDIMERIEKPKGLVRYASQDEIKHGRRLKFSGRMKAYSAVLFLLLVLLGILLATRRDFDVHVARMRGTTYQEQSNGDISNFFTLKLMNKSFHTFHPQIRLLQPEGGTLRIIGTAPELEGGSSAEVNIMLSFPAAQVKGVKMPVRIGVFKDDTQVDESEMVFFGPGDNS